MPDVRGSYWVLVFVSGTWFLDSIHQWNSGFQSPGFRIPPAKYSGIPGSKFPVFWDPDSLTWGDKLNVAKCNLGKVNLEAMLVSCFPSYSRGGPMPLAGAPRDLYMQLLACSSSQSVVAMACCLLASLCFGFSHPSLPLGVG